MFVGVIDVRLIDKYVLRMFFKVILSLDKYVLPNRIHLCYKYVINMLI